MVWYRHSDGLEELESRKNCGAEETIYAAAMPTRVLVSAVIWHDAKEGALYGALVAGKTCQSRVRL